MKVIIIKECKDGKINEVIDVASGYATNFLIKKGLALPFNFKTEHMLKNKVQTENDQEELKRQNATKAKVKIESIKLEFKLNATNNVVHGSITRKQIVKELLNKGVRLDSHMVESVKIASIGISKVEIKLYKDIFAILKVEVSNEN